MQKSLLSVAILLAFSNLSTAQEVNSLINDDQTFEGDVTIKVTEIGEASNRFAGIGLNDTQGNRVMDITSNGNITISGDQTTLNDRSPNRLYGVVAGHQNVPGNQINIEASGNVIANLTGSTIDTRGFRANGGSISIKGKKIEVHATSSSNQAIGVEAWYDSSLKLEADEITIESTGAGEKNYGIQSCGGTDSLVSLKSKKNTITVQTDKELSSLYTGIYANHGKVELYGDTSVNVKGGSGNNFGLSLESDESNNDTSTINFYDNAKVVVEAEGGAFGMRSSGKPSNINFKKNATVTATSTSSFANGMQVQYSGGIQVDGNINITTTAGTTANGILNADYSDGTLGRLTVNGTTTVVATGANAFGIRNLVTGNFATRNDPGISLNGATQITATATSDTGLAVGIDANYDSSILVTEATVTAKSAKGEAFGLRASDEGKVTLTGTTKVTAEGKQAVGMSVKTGATVDLTGETTISGTTSFEGDATSVVNVGALNGKAGSLVLNGNVNNSGVINLTNSSLEVKGTTTQANLGNIQTQGADNSQIALSAGDFVIESLKGENKSLVLNDLMNTEAVQVKAKEGNLTLVATSDSNNQYNNVNETLEALGTKLDFDKTNDNIVIEEGLVNDSLTATFDKDGKVADIVVTKNSSLDAYSSIATLSAFQWRHDMNDLTKRMGELRMSPEGVGAWARVYGSKQTYGAQNITAKNHSVQVGVDADVGNGWKVGTAFTYTDGQSTYADGKGDNKAYGIAAYGSWFAENGQFVDLIAKYSRLSNDFTVNSMAGSCDNNAYSLSAEYGWHFNLANTAFVEPQIEVTYGKVIGEDFTAGNGVRIEQEDFESLIARAGVRSGFYFPDNKGVIYARASVLHDFKGEMESTARLDPSVNSVKDDIGGTWYEFGLGANFNMSPTTYIYVDLERTNGGAVVEDWKYNLGVRHAF